MHRVALVALTTSFFLSILALPHPHVSQVAVRQAASIPQYVLDYAPLVWLHADEAFFPSSIANQLVHTHPEDANFTDIQPASSPLTLDNLDQLNNLGGGNVWLSSDDDFTTLPDWMRGVKPDANGKTEGVVSCAVILQDKGNGVLDAYYMYFFAYNQGDFVLEQELGDHLGDWEHTMVRFNTSTGTPQSAWLSQHAAGGAYQYSALEKMGERAVVYSGNGTHANYATVGSHDHTIPGLPAVVGILNDYTNRGTLWDPIQGAYFYTVTFPEGTAIDDSSNPTFEPLNDAPTNWLYFLGKYGDNQLPKSDPRQVDTIYPKYVGGPTGPRDKQLLRSTICGKYLELCDVKSYLPPGA